MDLEWEKEKTEIAERAIHQLQSMIKLADEFPKDIEHFRTRSGSTFDWLRHQLKKYTQEMIELELDHKKRVRKALAEAHE